MSAAAVGLVLVVKGVLERVLGLAVSAVSGTGIAAGSYSDVSLQILSAMALPGVQAEIRLVLLPALVTLCGLVGWSMIDAYRRARR